MPTDPVSAGSQCRSAHTAQRSISTDKLLQLLGGMFTAQLLTGCLEPDVHYMLHQVPYTVGLPMLVGNHTTACGAPGVCLLLLVNMLEQGRW
jgi:hypothetical protein